MTTIGIETFEAAPPPVRIRRRWLTVNRRPCVEYQVVTGREIVDRFAFLEAAIDQYPKARIDRQLFRQWRP